MKLRIAISLFAGLVMLASSTPAQTALQTINSINTGKKMLSNPSNEVQVRQVIENFVEAFRTRNVEMMMSLYTQDFVAFDIVPPLQDVGKDEYQEIWEKVFAFFQGPIVFETRDLSISAGTDVAFSRQLLRLQATLANGQKVDRWERLTFGLQKINGIWLIAHEHVSVPADLLSGKAVLDLKP